MQSLSELREEGFTVINTPIRNSELLEIFTNRYKSKFTADTQRNRNLVKQFANDISVREAFLVPEIPSFLRTFMVYPVITGPLVSHWTSTDQTGGSYGLPYHQDWPSMGTSANSVVCWMALEDVDQSTHGVAVIPKSHVGGAMKGSQTAEGYIVEVDNSVREHIVQVEAGQVLIMSSWLAHRTHINPACLPETYKLSLSLRFDDLEDGLWDRRNYISAFQNVVDRDVWKMI